MEGVVGGTGAAGGVRSSLSMHTASGMAMSMGLGLRTDLGSLGWFIGIWATMMGAMMLPPVMRAATSAHRATRVAGSQASALAFAVGYMVVWTASGLVGYGGIDAIQPVVPSWKHGGRYVAAVVLLGAAAFELTPLKASCLRICRDWSPSSRCERGGVMRALIDGVDHSRVCIGCCWALMVGLFALGVMRIGWMPVIAGVIAIQKLLPASFAWRWVAAILLAALALAAAF